MKYTKIHLDKGYNIHQLKELLTELGGTPGTLNKEGLIDAVLKIQDGEVPPKKVQGRKSKSEKLKELLKSTEEGYEEDEFVDVSVENNPNGEYDEDVALESTIRVSGTFEKSENYEHGFLRGNNFKSSAVSDVYVSAQSIKFLRLRDGDFVEGLAVRGRDNGAPSLKKIEKLNGAKYINEERISFSELEPIYPDRQIKLEVNGENDLSLRAIDLLCPIGRGQRALIVAPPKAGKTTLIKKIASSIDKNYNDIYLMVVLIGERPEEVTDFKRSVNCELIYSTFDEKAKNHVKITKLAIEKAKRQVETGKHVVLLLDSITRLTRAYNEVLPSSGKTLTGGIDPVALQEAKGVFGTARNFDKGGSLTIIATALVDTGSKMDDIIYEEFKGTGNSELFLSRKLSEMRVFPSIDLRLSGTRRDDLLLDRNTFQVSNALRRSLENPETSEINVFVQLNSTKTNAEFVKLKGEKLKLKGEKL